jgi:titin
VGHGRHHDGHRAAPAGLNRGTKYHYRVVAANAAGESAPSLVVQETTAPDAPANVAAVAAGRSVAVTWDAAPGATGYTVERSANGTSGWASVGTTDGDTLAYTNTGLTAGTRYYYRVVAANQAGRSEASAVASDTTVPPTPASLTANAVSTSRIDLTWAAAPGTTTYVVERSADGSTGWAQLTTVAGNVTMQADNGLGRRHRVPLPGAGDERGGRSGPTATASDVTVPPAPLSPAVVAAGTAGPSPGPPQPARPGTPSSGRSTAQPAGRRPAPRRPPPRWPTPTWRTAPRTTTG